MINILKKFFHNPEKETIKIFEEKTKISYDSKIFLSLKVLSLTDTKIKNPSPLAVFINLEILNLSNNKIQNISFLKDLGELKIIDLRFNKIEKIPLWIFQLERTLYWERTDEQKEGIYLEGNPLGEKLIAKIKNSSEKKRLTLPKIKKELKKAKVPMEIEQLIPLKRVHVAIFLPQSSLSNFVKNFNNFKESELKLNLSIMRYNTRQEILNPKQQKFQDLKHIILILNDTECCINPPILESISKLYSKSKIFLIIENSNKKNIKEKISFFKTYNNSGNIIQIYHSFDKESNEHIRDNIYTYLNKTQEANSLWRKNWIELLKEIEAKSKKNIDKRAFIFLADKYRLETGIRDDIFVYLKKIGSIKERKRDRKVSLSKEELVEISIH